MHWEFFHSPAPMQRRVGYIVLRRASVKVGGDRLHWGVSASRSAVGGWDPLSSPVDVDRRRSARRIIVESDAPTNVIDRFRVGLGLAVLLVASSALGQDGGLSASELAALGRGDLVARETHETRDGRLWIGGVSYLRVYRPREQVWRALHDLAHWRDMLPSVSEVRVEDAGARESLVEIHHAYGPIQAQYTLRVAFDERAHRCSFELALERRHDIRAGHGFVEVHRWHDDPSSSILVWAVLGDPGDGLLTPLVLDPVTHESVRVPWRIRAFLDGPGAALYRD